MDSGIDIVEWAKKLGFEGAYDKKFREASSKLVPPSMRSVWRHIISHVLPIEKARSIRKHCLLYKLELEESIHKNVKLQARVKSLKEYERYVKINSLKIMLSDLHVKIETHCNELKSLLSRLDAINEKYKVEKEKEEEQLNKYKLIELKVKSTKNEIKKLKEMEYIVDYYINARSEISYSESSSEWESEVIEYCNELPKGQEISKLCEELKSLLQTTLKFKAEENLTFEKKSQLLQEMHLIQLKKFLKAQEYQKNYESFNKKIILSKQKCFQKFNEHHGNLLQEEFERILSSNIENIVEHSEATDLTDLENLWSLKINNCNHTDQYTALQKEIAHFNEQIEGKINSISELMSGQNKIKVCLEAQEVIKAEPKELVAEIKVSHKKLIEEIIKLNFLPEEIDLFLKTSLPRNSSSFRNLEKPAATDSLFKFGKYNLIMEDLKFELPDIEVDAEREIHCFKNNEHIIEEELKNTFRKLRETVENIQKLKSASLSHIEFWKEQPLAEGSRASPEDYLNWRTRCKEALKNLQIEDHEFD